MYCVAQPAHNFFGEETPFDSLIVNNNVVFHADPTLDKRKCHSDTLAAMLDINDRFNFHSRLGRLGRGPENH
jgi:hypothetical protein